MNSRDNFDREAEREALALQLQGLGSNMQTRRIAESEDYNKVVFDKLFKTKGR